MMDVKLGAVASPYPSANLDYWVKVKHRFLQQMEARTVRVSLFTGGGPKFDFAQLDTLLNMEGTPLTPGTPRRLTEMILSSVERPRLASVMTELPFVLEYIASVPRGEDGLIFVYELGNEPDRIEDIAPEAARDELLECLQFLNDSKERGTRFNGRPIPGNLIWAVGMPSDLADERRPGYSAAFLANNGSRGGLLDYPYKMHLVTVNCYGEPTLEAQDEDQDPNLPGNQDPDQLGDPYRVIRWVRARGNPDDPINIKVTEANIASPITIPRDPPDEVGERALGEASARGEQCRAFALRFATPPENDPEPRSYRNVNSVCFYGTPCVEQQIYNLTFNAARRIAGRPLMFSDVPLDNEYLAAIENLAALGIFRGNADGSFGFNASTLRAQMAAIICRSMPAGDTGVLNGLPGVEAQTWAGEDRGNPFTDRCDPDDPTNCVDPALWRAVGTLAFYGVAQGYGGGIYAPRDEVLRAQMISFITRAMVRKGFWTGRDDPGLAALYPNVPVISGHRADIATYVHYVGPVPEAFDPAQNFPSWDQPAKRQWSAQALWQGIRNDLFRMPPFTFHRDPERRYYDEFPNLFTSRFINPATQGLICDPTP